MSNWPVSSKKTTESAEALAPRVVDHKSQKACLNVHFTYAEQNAVSYSNLQFFVFIYFLCSTSGWLSNLSFAISSFPACANSKFQRSGEEQGWIKGAATGLIAAGLCTNGAPVITIIRCRNSEALPEYKSMFRCCNKYHLWFL